MTHSTNGRVKHREFAGVDEPALDQCSGLPALVLGIYLIRGSLLVQHGQGHRSWPGEIGLGNYRRDDVGGPAWKETHASDAYGPRSRECSRKSSGQVFSVNQEPRRRFEGAGNCRQARRVPPPLCDNFIVSKVRCFAS